jgi:FkbM family methyltransferase
MTFSNIKNKLFKNTMKIIGNKGLANNYIGKNVKLFLVKNAKNNQVVVNGYKMYLDKNDVMQISLFDYDPIETELVKSNVKKNDIVIDVGANMGYYTLLMAKTGAFVNSYEPAPSNFKLLQKNVHQNNFSQNVTLHNTAVSNFIGTSKLFLSEFTHGEHNLDYDRYSSGKFVEVPVTKINLDKIDFAKIDVEGSELHVLEGMKSLPNKILIEFNSSYLKESGSNYKDFFKFLNKYSIKEISKTGLIEPDYDKLIENKLATNLFLS